MDIIVLKKKQIQNRVICLHTSETYSFNLSQERDLLIIWNFLVSTSEVICMIKILLVPSLQKNMSWLGTILSFLLLIIPCPTFHPIKTFYFLQFLFAPLYSLERDATPFMNHWIKPTRPSNLLKWIFVLWQ